MGNVQGGAGVLLHQQDGGAVLVQLLDDIKNLLHQDGRQAHGRLVQHQQLGVAHQGAAHGQHLLFSAGQRSGDLLAALFQPGKPLEHVVQVICTGLTIDISTHFKVFLHGHLEEDSAPFGNQGQTLGDNLMTRRFDQRFTQKSDISGLAVEQAGDGIQRGGFSRAVGADQGNDLTLVDLEGNAFDGMDAAVINVDVFHFQDGVHTYASSFFLPR